MSELHVRFSYFLDKIGRWFFYDVSKINKRCIGQKSINFYPNTQPIPQISGVICKVSKIERTGHVKKDLKEKPLVQKNSRKAANDTDPLD